MSDFGINMPRIKRSRRRILGWLLLAFLLLFVILCPAHARRAFIL